jgi:hypothetical protein
MKIEKKSITKCSALIIMGFMITHSILAKPMMRTRASSSSSGTTATGSSISNISVREPNFNDVAAFILRHDVEGLIDLFKTAPSKVAQLQDPKNGVTVLQLAAEEKLSRVVEIMFSSRFYLSMDMKQQLVNAKDFRG